MSTTAVHIVHNAIYWSHQQKILKLQYCDNIAIICTAGNYQGNLLKSNRPCATLLIEMDCKSNIIVIVIGVEFNFV